MDIVIIKENEEDLYAGIVHQQTGEVVQYPKIISRPGREKIVRYAFEFTKQYDRKKVTCFTKDNVMKQTDGLFHQVFDEIAKEYSQIENGQALNLPKYKKRPQTKKVLIGHNVFVHWNGTDANELGYKMSKIGTPNLKLNMIINRGIKVWPDSFAQTFCTDHWRCRFKTEEGKSITKEKIIILLQQRIQNQIDAIKNRKSLPI